jgi:tetratricopeptide (TPR) repeat protein
VAINTGPSTNKLAVRKSGSALRFYVNDIYVDTTAFDGLFGDGVGIRFDTPLEAEVEYLQAEQYPAAADAWNGAGDYALANADVPAAIRYYALAGNQDRLFDIAKASAERGQVDAALRALQSGGLSEKDGKFRLASMLVAAGRNAEALAMLRDIGLILDKGALIRRVWDETFSNNRRRWPAATDATSISTVKGGSYHLENLSSDYRLFWNTVAIDPNLDFKIEARMRKLSGADDRSYSLYWGLEDGSRTQEFGIVGAGFVYGYFQDGIWTSVLRVPISPAVHQGNAENSLAVLRAGDKQRLFINGIRVGEVPFREYTGGGVGFTLNGKIAVDVDELKITEYPPDFALDLARTELFASKNEVYAAALAAMYMDRGDYGKALTGFLEQNDSSDAHICNQRLGEEALIAGKADKAVEYFLQAGISEDSYRTLASAYKILGQKDNADAATFSLAEMLYAKGSGDDALALYRQLTKPALLDAAGLLYFGAGDYAVAASFFKASGNAVKEMESYNLDADGQAKEGRSEAAIVLYRKAGLGAKADELEKRLTSLSPAPLMGVWMDRSATAAGLRIVDTNGFSVDIGEPRFTGKAAAFTQNDKDVFLSFDEIEKATFNWTKMTVSVTAPDKKNSTLALTDYAQFYSGIEGFVYQADAQCPFRIELRSVKSIARIDIGATKAERFSAGDFSRRDCRMIDMDGVSYAMTDVGFFSRNTFSTGWRWGPSEITEEGLDDDRYNSVISITLGAGSYGIPLNRVASLSFKDKSFISRGGFRCPFFGKIAKLVVIAGDTPQGRLAMYTSSIAELEITREEYHRDPTPKVSWSIACSTIASARPYLNLAEAQSEIFSTGIDWNATDSILAFRASLYDYKERVDINKRMAIDYSLSIEAIPISVGHAHWAVPFRLVNSIGMDAKGNLRIALKDGSVMKGLAYKNWTGFVGKTAQGVYRLARQKIPAYVAFLEAEVGK